MKPRDPIAQLPTHEVINMPPHIGDQHLWRDDQALRRWTEIQGGAGHADHLAQAALTHVPNTQEMPGT
jgi:putative acyl-CoA dehydrogenase